MNKVQHGAAAGTHAQCACGIVCATGGLLHLPMSHRPLGLAGSLPRVLSVDWHPFALRKECLHVSSDS